MMVEPSLAQAVRELAHRAGEAILAVYADESSFATERKDDDSPLTAADRAANEVICAGLAALTPDIPIISEENKHEAYEQRREWTRCWLVDPLDGTKEFVKRNGDFTVNIALIENGRPIFGAVHTPVTGHHAWGIPGQGAWEADGRGAEPRPMRVARFAWADPGLRVVASHSHRTPETDAYIARFQAPEIIARGSSLKFLLVASGQAHVYPRLGPTSEWDTAAAQAIVEGAGGVVLHYETHQPLQYNKPSLLNPWFVVYGKTSDDDR
jgi:3'(2'), 5'-bisphosphate nucleotidase